jgi:phosphatidylinositol alpha-1,6-mannosyltransferase
MRRGKGGRPAAQHVVRIFSEARLHQNSGTVLAIDRNWGAASWDGYVDRLGAVQLAARVGPPDPVAHVPVGRIEIHPLPYYLGPRQLIRRLPRVLPAVVRATRDPALCLFGLPGTLSMLGAAWCRLAGRPYAVELVGDPADALRAGVLGTGGGLLAPAAAALTRWLTRGAAAGRYVTEVALQRAYPLAAGVPEHHYSNVKLDEAAFTGPRVSRPIRRLIAVGSQDQLYKGHDDLITAVALLARRGLDLELDLVGDGRFSRQLRDLAADSGVGDRVRFLGRVNDRTELHRLLDAADLFCMPSRTEGLPRALIEAMARGLPAVGTHVGGIPELLPPRFRVPPSDPVALARLLASFVQGEVDLEEASQLMWERAQHFSLERQRVRVDCWLDTLGALAHSARSGPSSESALRPGWSVAEPVDRVSQPFDEGNRRQVREQRPEPS